MYYIVVKEFSSVGSIVYESEDSNEIDRIDDLLNSKLDGEDKQVVLLSNLEMWKEYEPFQRIEDAEEFVEKALFN